MKQGGSEHFNCHQKSKEDDVGQGYMHEVGKGEVSVSLWWLKKECNQIAKQRTVFFSVVITGIQIAV
jgi:hypothetical protein